MGALNFAVVSCIYRDKWIRDETFRFAQNDRFEDNYSLENVSQSHLFRALVILMERSARRISKSFLFMQFPPYMDIPASASIAPSLSRARLHLDRTDDAFRLSFRAISDAF